MKNPDQLRHILKTISWRIVGTLDTMIVSYIITGSMSIGLAIGGFEVITKMILYYIHERIWYNYVSLGRKSFAKAKEIQKIGYQHNITHQNYSLTHLNRIERNKHSPKVFWMSGLSGSGKSSIANALQNELFLKGYQVYVLDGDNIRHGLNSDLDFSNTGRIENIRRIAEVAKLFADSGFIVITAFISPFQADREQAKKIIGADYFCEVFVNTPLEICEKRDVKGLYRKARNGEITNFTGIDSAFEEPNNPDIVLYTSENSIEKCVNILLEKVPILQVK